MAFYNLITRTFAINCFIYHMLVNIFMCLFTENNICQLKIGYLIAPKTFPQIRSFNWKVTHSWMKYYRYSYYSPPRGFIYQTRVYFKRYWHLLETILIFSLKFTNSKTYLSQSFNFFAECHCVSETMVSQSVSHFDASLPLCLDETKVFAVKIFTVQVFYPESFAVWTLSYRVFSSQSVV